ncbi:MAG: peptide ABC transporter substrate-binding protein [Spirochaetales bacterium]|uniref:Peptide ABC transporter substrate-binding protein n=1 Tax=Candidatus Thalassospirochaeta sargassi TaxID=3119039 RepID=A0AAJ1IAH2_9SPIO|nr:peptide ABC transporter substrate-binding protein [Spirochaetales bacterium]
MKKNLPILKFIAAALFIITFSTTAFAGGAQESGAAEKTRLNVAWTAGQSLDSLIIDENWQYLEMGCTLWQLCYDQLWIMGDAESGYAAQPMLATHWDVSEDKRTWTFYLRDDAVFHDGTPVTAYDVEFTFEYLPASDPAWDMVDFYYESMTVIDDYTIEITMVNPFGMPYPPMYWAPILPKHIWEPYKDNFKSYENDHMLGSGMYKIKEFKAGQYVWLEANEDYWGGAPGVDEIVFKIYGAEDTRNMAIQNGEADMVGYLGISPLTIEDFEDVEGIDVLISPDINIYWLNFNLHQKNGIQDLEVRKAIMHAVDVERIIEMALVGYGEPADSFVYKELEWYNDDITRYPYDAARAEAILDAAGYKDTDGDGVRNEKDGSGNMSYELLATADVSEEVKAATIIAEMLGDVGIDVQLKLVDTDTYYNYLYTPDEDYFDFSLSTEGPGPNGEWFWDFCRGWDNGGAGWNTAYYSSDEFDTAMDNMMASNTLEEKNMYRKEMQKIISEDIPYGIIFRKEIICPVNTAEFTGYTATMGGTSNWINPWSFLNIEAK